MSMQDPGDCANLGLSYDSSTGLCTVQNPGGFAGFGVSAQQGAGSLGQSGYQQSSSDNPGETVVSGSTTVNVNNTVNIADQTLNNVAGAVKTAVASAAQTAADIARTTEKDISDALGTVATSISDTISSAFNTLWGWIKDVASAISSVSSAIWTAISNGISSAVGTLANAVKDVLGPISDVVQQVAKQLQQINDQLIQPVMTTINKTISTISSLTTAIERDLHSGLAGIVAIPGQISDAMTSLDATMQRTMQQLPDSLKKGVADVLVGGATDSLGTPLTDLSDGITSISGKDARETTFSAHVKLPEPGILGASAAAITAAWAQIQNLFSSILRHGQDNIDQIKAQLSGIPFMLGDGVELSTTLMLLVGSIIAELVPLYNYEVGQANALMGLAKLPPADALQAYLRQFIDSDTLTAELSTQGWDAERIQVIKDLQIQLLDVASVLDMYFRGIVQEDDLRANLLQHGFVPQDQDALILQAHRLVDVQTGVTAWLRQLISSDQLTDILKQNRFTDNEISLFYSTALRPENAAELIERKNKTGLWTSRLILDQTLLTAPQDVIQAAQIDALSPQVATDMWMNQLNVPQLEYWISLYFRGVRTLTELHSVMDYYHVPQEWRDDMIQANRALIPFRTIPTMLADGLISESYAQTMLAAHGFDLQAVNALLAYAKVAKKTASPVNVSDLKSISVAQAKTAWDDGALTEDQYSQVLAAHGFDQNAIDLTIKVQAMEQQIKERQQTGTDIVNETLAGFITVDQAKQQLNSNSFTLAEQAKYLKQIARVKAANAKLPSRTDLKDFWKAGIIQAADYVAGMISLGYTAQVVQWFQQLDQPPAPTATPSTSGA